MTDAQANQRVEQRKRDGAQDDGFAMLDGELRYVMLNETMALMNGVPVAEHLGRTVGEVVPALAPTLEPLLRHVLMSGESILDVEVHGVPELEGTTRRWLASFSPIRSRNGLIVAIDCVVRALPVLARPSSSALIFSTPQEHEHFAARVAEASPYLIYVYDLPTNRNRYTNRRLEQLYGYSQADLDAMGPGFLFRLIHPDDIAGVLGQVDRLRAAPDGQLLTHEYRFRHNDGSWRWICSHELVFKRDAAGAVTQILGIAEDVTARKAAEAVLRWQADLVDHSHEAVLVSDTDGALVYWSTGAERLYGFSRAEALGRPCHELLQTQPRQELPRIAAELELAGAWSGELTRVTCAGREVVVGSRMTVIAGPDGQPQVLETNRDLTARMAAELALQRSEQRWRFALRAAGMVAWEYDLVANTAVWSPGTEAFFGFAPGAFGGTFADLLAITHPDDRVAAAAAVERALRSGVYQHQFRLLRPDGFVVWLQHQGEVVYDAQGAPHTMLGVSQDITDLKAAQEALRVSEERFRVALQGSPIVVFNQDRELRYTWVHNPALGYSAQEMIGATDSDLCERPEDAEHLTGLKRQVLESGAGRRQEVCIWSEGAPKYYDLTVEPLRDATDLVVGVTCAAVDVTERKRAEAERAELLVRERNAHQATEAALLRAEAATRERDLLISIAAHDLRTPLTVILGQAHLLQRRGARTGLDERSQRTLNIIAEQAERLNQMIRALLDLSRIQEGRLTIQPEPLDLGVLLERIVGTMQSTVTVHEVVLRPLDRPTTLRADPLRLEQVFLNLLGNAVKYSPNGGRIEVWAERSDKVVQVQISDEGIGIPEEALPHLFTRFYRAPNAAEQATSSLGVGLFIVRELVQAHGGTITVTSTVNRGSTFTVSFPLPGADEQV